jgi:hypothetical protein
MPTQMTIGIIRAQNDCTVARPTSRIENFFSTGRLSLRA